MFHYHRCYSELWMDFSKRAWNTREVDMDFWGDGHGCSNELSSFFPCYTYDWSWGPQPVRRLHNHSLNASGRWYIDLLGVGGFFCFNVGQVRHMIDGGLGLGWKWHCISNIAKEHGHVHIVSRSCHWSHPCHVHIINDCAHEDFFCELHCGLVRVHYLD